MAKPVLSYRGLNLVPLKKKHIMPFFRNMSAENMAEFTFVYDQDPLESLLAIVDEPMTFVVEKDGEPLAITGLQEYGSHGLMWCLFSKNMRSHWISFARASKALINFYHGFNAELYCDVWTENAEIHQWLVYLGFLPEAIVELENRQELVRFVRCDERAQDVHTHPSRPVMH